MVMISSEMPELLGMCDRIYVMNEGGFVGELTAAEASQEAIMALIVRRIGGTRGTHRKRAPHGSGRICGAAHLREYGHADRAGRDHGLLPDRHRRRAAAPGEHHQPVPAEQLHHHHGAWHAAGDRGGPYRPVGRLGHGLHRGAGGGDDRADASCRSGPSIPAICLVVGMSIGAAQGYWVAYWQHPLLHRDAGGDAGVPRADAVAAGRAERSGRSRKSFQALSTGFMPDPASASDRPNGLALAARRARGRRGDRLASALRGRGAQTPRYGIEDEPFGLFFAPQRADRGGADLRALEARDVPRPAERADRRWRC